MENASGTDGPMIGLGMTSVVLGTVGILFFFLPVLGIPVSAFALLFGIVGFLGSIFKGGAPLRWSLGGMTASALALSMNLAIAYAPAGYLPGRDVPKLWRSVPDRSYVPPPAQR
jgi:hypothetical protein